MEPRGRAAGASAMPAYAQTRTPRTRHGMVQHLQHGHTPCFRFVDVAAPWLPPAVEPCALVVAALPRASHQVQTTCLAVRSYDGVRDGGKRVCVCTWHPGKGSSRTHREDRRGKRWHRKLCSTGTREHHQCCDYEWRPHDLRGSWRFPSEYAAGRYSTWEPWAVPWRDVRKVGHGPYGGAGTASYGWRRAEQKPCPCLIPLHVWRVGRVHMCGPCQRVDTLCDKQAVMQGSGRSSL